MYSSLPSHLYTRGLLGGKHSDITIIAFGRRYNLHRIVLDRAPFFANALTEPWLEATAKEVERQVAGLARSEETIQSLRDFGCLILVRDEEEACRITDLIAPEHLLRLGADGVDLACGDVDRHHRRLRQDDAAAADVDQRVGSPEIDRHVAGWGYRR